MWEKVRSTGIVLVYPKTRDYDDFNGIHNIFLLLTQSNKCNLNFLDVCIFCTTFKSINLKIKAFVKTGF